MIIMSYFLVGVRELINQDTNEKCAKGHRKYGDGGLGR